METPNVEFLSTHKWRNIWKEASEEKNLESLHYHLHIASIGLILKAKNMTYGFRDYPHSATKHKWTVGSKKQQNEGGFAFS